MKNKIYHGMTIQEIEHMKAYEKRKKKRQRKIMMVRLKLITLFVISFFVGIVIALKIYS